MSKKKKIIISFLSFAFVVMLSCGMIFLPDWSQIGGGEKVSLPEDTIAANEPTNPSTYWDAYRASSFAGGDGSESNPYQIATAEQLALLAYRTNTRTGELMEGEDNKVYQYGGCYFIQTKHIDLSAHYWVPIGGTGNAGWFCGTYDGNGYTISGLFTPSGDTTDFDYSGLFGWASSNLLSGGQMGEIKNLGIVNSYVQGNACVGAIAGALMFASVSNCYNTGNVYGNSEVGGIVGNSGFGSISNCFNAGTIQGVERNVGGISGTTGLSYAQSCFNTGKINGRLYTGDDGITVTQNIGGIVGGDGTAYNCYNTGEVAQIFNTTKGGIGGGSVNVYNCFYGGNCSSSTGAVNNADTDGGKYLSSLSENTFKTLEFFENSSNWSYTEDSGEVQSSQWDFSIWGVDGRANSGFPYFIKSLYEVDINIWSHENAQDYRSGTMTQTYNGKSYTGSDQAFKGLYVYESWTISNIRPAEGYLMDSISATYGTLTDNGDGTYTYEADYSRPPAGSGTLDAVINIRMTREDYTVTVNPNGGTLNGSSSTTTQTVTYRDMINLATPTRTGYTFKGWQVTSGDATVTETQYLWEEQSFDGVDDYIAIGRDQMYTDKITVSIMAYMDNWSLYSSRDMHLISCTEGGGWNFETDSNGNIKVPVYDSGVGYKYVTASKSWASLSSGWHEFTFSFDGHNVRLFIDGVMEGKSANFSSGKIGYYSSNVIFIGAEAGWTTTTPAGGYFEGIIESVIIVNDYVYGADFSQAGSFVIPRSDVTIRAIWEDTWARHYTKPEGSGTEEDPYRVSTASELAYFAYKTQIQGQESYDYIVLTDDIDLAGYDWLPMGRARGTSTGFRGTFDGQGHTISNLNVNVSGIAKNTEYGLFGLVDSGAVIKNFSIISGQVNGFDNSICLVSDN